MHNNRRAAPSKYAGTHFAATDVPLPPSGNEIAPIAGANGSGMHCAKTLAARFQSERYFTARVVNQICGAPLTPAFSMISFNRADDANSFAVRHS